MIKQFETKQINLHVTTEMRVAWIRAARKMYVKPGEFARFAIAEKIAAMATKKNSMSIKRVEVQHDRDPQTA